MENRRFFDFGLDWDWQVEYSVKTYSSWKLTKGDWNEANRHAKSGMIDEKDLFKFRSHLIRQSITILR